MQSLAMESERGQRNRHGAPEEAIVSDVNAFGLELYTEARYTVADQY